MISKIAIVYSFNSNKSKKVAEKISEAFGKDAIEVINAEDLTKNDLERFDRFILSSPTWFDGELPNYWDEFIPDLEEMDLRNKKFAVFGLGDQKEYSENFCDAVGILVEILENCGAEIIGNTSVEGYDFESSKAQRGEQFVGLLIDQENQARLTGKRIEAWVEQLKKELE